MKPNVWEAWWREHFDLDEYLYHYTTFDTALKILHSDKFQFSPLSKTNDTTEQKLRISYAFSARDRREDIADFEKYWLSWSANSKLLCFSQDRPKDPLSSAARFHNIFDMRGRGFALPRMWAQYADKNSGVCLIIRKKPFIEKVSKIYPESICRAVSYFDWSDSYEISESLFLRLLEIIRHNPTTGYAPTFLRDNPEFAQYSYFSKLKDWEGESEYRILLPNSDAQHPYLYMEGVKTYLAGIVLGEYIDDSKIYAIKSILSSTIPIRKIIFELSRCSVANVSSI